ncbi:Hypothetical predicted protein [Marmota monax]|uniref:Uncharacterized protein n=1 Tax=Marmota monax TaxID=9995 RepID=A0A5E4A580_MARMO|nr:Hypothetical predicted protein [Marmota monax]
MDQSQAVQGVLCEGDSRQSRLLGLVRYPDLVPPVLVRTHSPNQRRTDPEPQSEPDPDIESSSRERNSWIRSFSSDSVPVTRDRSEGEGRESEKDICVASYR